MARFLQELSELEVVIRAHGNRVVTPRCFVGFRSEKIKRADTNETSACGIFRLPRSKITQKEYAKGRTEEA